VAALEGRWREEKKGKPQEKFSSLPLPYIPYNNNNMSHPVLLLLHSQFSFSLMKISNVYIFKRAKMRGGGRN
jgi:hypothetical protein